MSSRLIPGFKRSVHGAAESPQAGLRPAAAEGHGHGQRGQGLQGLGSLWVWTLVRGRRRTGFHSPPSPTATDSPAWTALGVGRAWGDRWGHGPAPLRCQHGGKTLRVRAELGVGDALTG